MQEGGGIELEQHMLAGSGSRAVGRRLGERELGVSEFNFILRQIT